MSQPRPRGGGHPGQAPATTTMITATTKKQDHRQDSARSAQHRRIVALVRLGDRREAARLAAERDWLVRRELDQLVREQPYSGRWTA